MKVVTSTECGGSVRPCLHGYTVEAESPCFSYGEYVNIYDRPEFREYYHLNGQTFDGIWIGSQRIDETNIHEWIGVRVLRVRNIDFYTEKTHDHIDVPNNLTIKCMVRKRNPGTS